MVLQFAKQTPSSPPAQASPAASTPAAPAEKKEYDEARLQVSVFVCVYMCVYVLHKFVCAF